LCFRGGFFGLLGATREFRDNDGRQNPEDHQDQEQFDQGETVL
jgi:hypothetical protein